MTKAKAIGWSVVCGVIVIFLLPTQFAGCAMPFLLIAVVFGLVALYKHWRDKSIALQAYQPQHTYIEEVHIPPMTTKGSNGRLFVPPPLQ